MNFLDRFAARLGYTPKRAAAMAEEAAVARASERAAVMAGRRVLAAAAQQQRSLLAALTTNDVASWQPDGLHLNAATSAGLAVVRARSRDAALNNGYARRFLGMVRSNVLGPHGVRYQARVRTGAGDLRQTVNDRLESAWAAWARRGACEITGRYTWRDVQRLALRGMAVDGEVFIRLHPGRGPHGLQLQVLGADWVPLTTTADLGGGKRIRQGVEIDRDGAVLAYHCRRDDPAHDALIGPLTPASQRLERVPVDRVLHLMLHDEAGQLRGVPWMATALKRMYQAADFASAGLNKARESAKRGGFIRQHLDAETTAPEHHVDGEDADGVGYAGLSDNNWERLAPGQEAQPFSNEYPSIEYGQFIKDCLRDIASAVDVAYITLGNDLEAVNYSSGQLGLEGERTTWLTLQGIVIDSLVEPVHRLWLQYALLTVPELQTLQYARLDSYAEAARWVAHRWQPLDPLKTIEAQRSRIEARLTSPQRVIAEGGDDPDEILAELREWAAKTADLPAVVPPSAAAGSAGQDPAAQDPAAQAAAGRAALRLQLIAATS